MLWFENECVGCPPDSAYPCNDCGKMRVPVYTCDTCGDEFEPEELYYDENDCMICADCILKKYKKVER